MKRNFLAVLVALLIVASAHGQFNQGRRLVGGSLTFNAYTTKDTPNTSGSTTRTVLFSATPNVGVFVVDRFAVGAGVNVSVSDSKFTGFTSGTGQSWRASLDPFVRWYFFGNGFIVANGGFGIQKTRFKISGSTSGNMSENENIWKGGIGIGQVFFLNDYIAFETIANYGITTYKSDLGGSSKSVQTGLGISFGFQIYLDRRELVNY